MLFARLKNLFAGGSAVAETDGAREKISRLLASGLATKTAPLPRSSTEFEEILAELRELASTDLEGKLIVAGFTNQPFGADKQRCKECMYYLANRKWCNLPELAVPVEARWWCRLWRI